MKRSHPFRFVKRFSKQGLVSYVVYDHDPAHTKSTGVLVDPRRRNYSWEPAGYDDAVAWAYTNMETIQFRSTITFREFAEHFFDPKRCTWTKRKFAKNHRKGVEDRAPFGAEYLPAHRGRLRNYLLPRWGSVPLNRISTKAIDEWLMDLDSARTGFPLSPASLDKVLTASRHILGEAKYQGYLSENQAAAVEPYSIAASRHRESFTLTEIRELFPNDIDEAIRIWQSLSWYGYFLMQWTCGLRPGEVGAFMLQDWIKEHHGAVIRRALENKTLEIKGLKTEKRGMTVKPVIFSDKLESLLTLLEFQGIAKDELLFTVGGRPIKAETANKHFKASAARAGVHLHNRTQYCLCHTFYTEALKIMPEKEVEKMAGHKTLRKEYDHRKGLDFLIGAQPLRDIVNKLQNA